MKFFPLFLLLLFTAQAWGQGLFDNATQSTETDNPVPSLEINGFMRGRVYGGRKPETHEADLKTALAELDFQLRARKGDWGQGYAQFRLRRGTELGQTVSEMVLREAYASAYLGPWDIRLGQQIVVWGRADGVNPTNNITPQNMLTRSSDEDDRREGNFLLRAFYTFSPFRVEAIWAPLYAASVLPLGLMPLPSGVMLNDTWTPPALLEESNVAFKLHFEGTSLDGSLSYFEGYAPLPGLAAAIPLDGSAVTVTPTPFRTRVFGADFQTTVGSLGLRGEAAYKKPMDDPSPLGPVPFAEWHVVLGVDRSWGDFNLILQVEGRHIPDWRNTALPAVFPLDPLGYLFIEKNRMLAGQLEKTQHGLVCRPSLSLLHETLSLEMLTLLRLTTEEWMVRPQISYDLADALSLTAGAELYGGPEGTLFGTVKDALSAGFVELKASF